MSEILKIGQLWQLNGQNSSTTRVLVSRCNRKTDICNNKLLEIWSLLSLKIPCYYIRASRYHIYCKYWFWLNCSAWHSLNPNLLYIFVRVFGFEINLQQSTGSEALHQSTPDILENPSVYFLHFPGGLTGWLKIDGLHINVGEGVSGP